jgi:hypothetical protein
MSKYMEYRVADERKGVWLDRLGVTVIPVGSVAREEERCVDQESVQVVLSEEDLHLLENVRCKMGFGLGSSPITEGSSGEEEERGEAEGSLELSITLCNRGVSSVLYAFIKAGLEHLSGDIGEFLSVSLREEMLAGLKLQRPFQTMWSSELRECDHPQATNELLRRAIMTVMRYNRSVSNPRLRWYLNADVLERLVPKSHFYVEWWLEIYQEEIDQHHQQFGLTAGGNVKAFLITEMIHLPDDPGLFEGDIEQEVETEGVFKDHRVLP